MKIPFFEAKDADSNIRCRGFYFEYPKTTYCFTEDYVKEPKCKLIPCLVTYRMTDWGLPNEPRLVRPIDKSTLKFIGYIDTNNEFYEPDNYLHQQESEESKIDKEIYTSIYNKAIDNFADKLLYQIGDLGIRDIIQETAEQLKAGGENESK